MLSRLGLFILLLSGLSIFSAHSQSITYMQDTIILNNCTSPSIGQIPFYNNTGNDITLAWSVVNYTISDSGFIALIIDPDQYSPYVTQGFYELNANDTSRVIAEFYMYNISAGDYAIYRVALHDTTDSLNTYKILTFMWSCGVNNINTIEEENKYISYPNPAENYIEFNIEKRFPKTFLLELFDVKGNVLMKNKYFITDYFKIDISHLENGIYFYKIIANDILITDKFIKQD